MDSNKKIKIAVLLSTFYQGGTFRLSCNIAKMLSYQGVKRGNCEIVFGNIDSGYNEDIDLNELKKCGISIRDYGWKTIDYNEAKNYESFLPGPIKGKNQNFLIPFDGGENFLDCDVWVMPCDRIFGVLLPLRPTAIFATDYIQRYIELIFPSNFYSDINSLLYTFIRNMRNADRVFAFTPPTFEDLCTYAGCTENSEFIDVVYDSDFIERNASNRKEGVVRDSDYCIWVTNGSYHKNHKRTLYALENFLRKIPKDFNIVVTGVNTNCFDPIRCNTPEGEKDHPYLKEIREIIANSDILRSRIIIKGNVSDENYVSLLSNARFLLHSVIADNGTYSVIEASTLGIPVLSSRYPQQEFINKAFGLNMYFFDPFDVNDLENSLFEMYKGNQKVTVDYNQLKRREWKNLSDVYFNRIIELCLKPRVRKDLFS